MKHFPTGSANRSQCIGLCDGFKFLSRYCECGSWWLAQLVIDVKQPDIYAKERIAKTMHTLSSIGIKMWMRVCVCGGYAQILFRAPGSLGPECEWQWWTANTIWLSKFLAQFPITTLKLLWYTCRPLPPKTIANFKKKNIRQKKFSIVFKS